MLRLQGQALQQLAQLPGATAGLALARPHGQAALGGPVALRPLGTHTLGCRGPTLPQAVTQPMLLGFNPFDVMMTPGMQAAVWGKKQQNEASCNTHPPHSPVGAAISPSSKGNKGAAFPPHFHLPCYPSHKHPSREWVPVARGLIASPI